MEELYSDFVQYFPLMVKNIKTTNPLSDTLLEIYYEDGSVGIFDRLLTSFRFIPNGKRRQMTESRWKIELGHKIYRTMMEKGILMTELSELSGVSYSTLSKYVNGHLTPGSYTLKRIASALGVEVGYLTDFEKYYD